MNFRPVDITRYGFSMLQIETMALCNMQCDFCSYPLRRDKKSILPETVVFGIIDSLLVTDGFKYVCLSQFNEPLLDKRIYAFIKHAKSRKVPVMIVTNGLLFNSREVIDRLSDAGPDYIKISMHVLNDDLFKRIRKAGCDFQQYKHGIFEFLKAIQNRPSEVTIDIACNFLSSKDTLKRLFGLEHGDPSVYNTIDDLREDSKSFLRELQEHLPSYKYDAAHVENYLADVTSNYAKEPGLKIANNIFLKVKPFIYGRRISGFYPIKKSRPCISTILGILASGSVVPCCMAYDDSFTLGSINTDPLNVILEKSLKVLSGIRMKGSGLPTACQHCLGAPTWRGAIMKKIRYAFRQN